MSVRTSGAVAAIGLMAPSNPATNRATDMIVAMPLPMTANAQPSSPIGASAPAIKADGATQNPMIGTAARLAINP